jgi:hypothetical protein
LVAQHPQQGRGRVGVSVGALAVNSELHTKSSRWGVVVLSFGMVTGGKRPLVGPGREPVAKVRRLGSKNKSYIGKYVQFFIYSERKKTVC